jgi:acyl-homoserine lactone acylase PvdQ
VGGRVDLDRLGGQPRGLTTGAHAHHARVLCAPVRRLAAFIAAALLAALLAATAALGAPEAYQQGDYKGFRNILPPGENGFDSGAQLLQFEANGTYPPHANDQLSMYGDLVHVAPHLKATDIGKYFKDGSFGVKPDDIERTYSPRSDVTIVRDKGFGTGHVYGTTRSGTMFGAGYIAAEDRLFFIDVLRHVGRAQLTSFAGGAAGNQAFDQSQWSIAPYTEADLQRQYDQLDNLYGAEGKQIQDDTQSYVDGINAYISQAQLNPNLMPGEYAAINQPSGPAQWKVTDIIATAALVGGIFGKGGGRELPSALVLEAAQKKFGAAKGMKVWSDFRSAEDPEAPTTVHTGKRFNYMATPRNVAKASLALPDPGSNKPVPVSQGSSSGSGGGAPPTCLPSSTICLPHGNSNALVVSGRESKSGHPLAVFGPQTGYFAPQILMDEDLHGPGIAARGASFPGVNLYVELGRGQDYAWSATSAGQDIIDTYAVDLCNTDGSAATIDSTGYLLDGKCTAMEKLERDNSWAPNAADQSPPGSETLVADRTAYGIVTSRATIKGKPVAYTVLRSTYMHEVDSARGFSDFNNPSKMRSPADFKRAAYKIGYTFNWLYVDNKHDAYFNSGNNPVRPGNVNPNFPVRARKPYLWRGFDPAAVTAKYTPASQHPQVVDQNFITSWNNKQAPGTRASDDQWGFSSVYRVMPLSDRVQRGIKGSRKMTLVGLINAMEDAGTVDLRADKALPLALRVIGTGKVSDPAVRAAVAKLRAWVRAGAHRRDLDNNGTYENSEAIRILDAWWPLWMKAEFGDRLGKNLFAAVQSMLPLDNAPNNHGSHLGSAYQDGWYGYASKDLRTVLGQKVRGRYSRLYCGRLATCRSRLIASLKVALGQDSASKLYGGDSVCQKAGRDGDQKCFDAVMMRPLGAVSQPLIDWINRPTFQQVVEIQGHR